MASIGKIFSYSKQPLPPILLSTWSVKMIHTFSNYGCRIYINWKFCIFALRFLIFVLFVLLHLNRFISLYQNGCFLFIFCQFIAEVTLNKKTAFFHNFSGIRPSHAEIMCIPRYHRNLRFHVHGSVISQLSSHTDICLNENNNIQGTY
jgi:hypothetical protein